MKNLNLRSLVVGPVMTNCYFLQNKETTELILVDPGAEAERISRMIEKLGKKPVAILLTHGHYDHMMAVNELRQEWKIPIFASKAEKETLSNPEINLSLEWEGRGYTVEADEYLEDGQEIELAGFKIRMYLTPGHTEGSCCYYFEEEELLMSGDTIFAGNCGRCDLPGGSFAQMQISLHKIIDHLPEEVRIYPGHGDETSIRHEKSYNPYL